MPEINQIDRRLFIEFHNRAIGINSAREMAINLIDDDALRFKVNDTLIAAEDEAKKLASGAAYRIAEQVCR